MATRTSKAKTTSKRRAAPTVPDAVRNYLSAIGRRGGRARVEDLDADDHSAMARKGGKVGGPARAKALTAKRRSEIARKAVEARWAKARKAAGESEPEAN